MKRLHTLLTMVAIAALSFTFTSCDDDEAIADTLWGTWEGDIFVSSTWSGHTYDATYSYISFDRDEYTWSSGTGYWIDYYSDAPWDYIANRIHWTVRNGDIRIHFVEDNYDVNIYDYRLNDYKFEGYIKTHNGTLVDFHLRKTSAPRWSDYHYGWDYWGDYYYGKQNGFVDETRATPNSVERPKRLFRMRE